MKDTLNQFWSARAPRERLVLGGGSVLLVLALGFAYGWLPMQREVSQLRQTLPQLREQARQLQQDAQEVGRLKAQPAAVREAGSLVLAVEQGAVASGLRERIASITPQGVGQVRVVLPRVGFDEWLGWLGELQTRHGVRVESARIEAAGDPGWVSVDVLLKAGG
ncbi:MAG: ral secretion pathway protein [Pseudomonadota bacterium]|nr:ral secretion pathway protein [Pseudomonadota bacterium]